MSDMPNPATVYGLKSTRDNRLRYIGQTQGDPIFRLYHHMAIARSGVNGRVPEWIRAEVADGFTIRHTVIVEHGTLNETERVVIARARASGYDLLNIRDGGATGVDGRIGKKPTPEARAKMSAAGKGRRHTAEAKAKMSAARVKKDYFLPKVAHEQYIDELYGMG